MTSVPVLQPSLKVLSFGSIKRLWGSLLVLFALGMGRYLSLQKQLLTFPLNVERLFSQDSISVNFSPNFPTSLNASCCAGHRNYSVH